MKADRFQLARFRGDGDPTGSLLAIGEGIALVRAATAECSKNEP